MLMVFLTGCSFEITSAAVVNSYVSDSGSVEVYMCPGECEEKLVEFIESV